MGFCSETGKDIFVPLTSVVPMADPNNFVLGGWDISKANLAESMYRAHVLVRKKEERYSYACGCNLFFLFLGTRSYEAG